jgi:hypothetical protein
MNERKIDELTPVPEHTGDDKRARTWDEDATSAGGTGALQVNSLLQEISEEDAGVELPAVARRLDIERDRTPLPMSAGGWAGVLVRMAREMLRDQEIRISYSWTRTRASMNERIKGVYPGPKSELFVGDLLNQVGIDVPTSLRPQGGLCYKPAVLWAADVFRFSAIEWAHDVRPGDVLVYEEPSRPGAAPTAHVEIVTTAEQREGRFVFATMGARLLGLTEDYRYGMQIPSGLARGGRPVVSTLVRRLAAAQGIELGGLGPRLHVLRPRAMRSSEQHLSSRT